MRHENISNDLQTTCQTLEIQLKELRAENDSKAIELAMLKELIKKDAESGCDEVKDLRAQVALLMAELKSRHAEPQESFKRMLNEAVSKDGKLNEEGDGDSDKIEVKLKKKAVSQNYIKKIQLFISLLRRLILKKNLKSSRTKPTNTQYKRSVKKNHLTKSAV